MPDACAGDLMVMAAALYTLGSVTVPSLASVYNELALKKHMDTSIDLQNWFLYFFGAVFNLAGMVAVATLGRQPLSHMFSGLSTVRCHPSRACTSMAGASFVSTDLQGWLWE